MGKVFLLFRVLRDNDCAGYANIATWNVFLRPAILTTKGPVSVSNAIIEYNADVVCLQEVFRQKQKEADSRRMMYIRIISCRVGPATVFRIDDLFETSNCTIPLVITVRVVV